MRCACRALQELGGACEKIPELMLCDYGDYG